MLWIGPFRVTMTSGSKFVIMAHHVPQVYDGIQVWGVTSSVDSINVTSHTELVITIYQREPRAHCKKIWSNSEALMKSVNDRFCRNMHTSGMLGIIF